MTNDIVKIICYGQEQEMTRSAAIRKFTEGVLACEGAERDRYANILSDLYCGLTVCTDQPNRL